jgi:hypothetical protein
MRLLWHRYVETPFGPVREDRFLDDAPVYRYWLTVIGKAIWKGCSSFTLEHSDEPLLMTPAMAENDASKMVPGILVFRGCDGSVIDEGAPAHLFVDFVLWIPSLLRNGKISYWCFDREHRLCLELDLPPVEERTPWADYTM